MGACAQATLFRSISAWFVAQGCHAREPAANILFIPSCLSMLFEKKSPPSDNHSWKDIPSDVGVLCFLIISVHYRHFYCFGANRIKISKSVQKTSKSNIFCTDFIIFPILAKISSYKRPKFPAFVFFQQKTAFSIQTELPEWWQPILQLVVDIFLKSVRRQGQCGHDVSRRF